MEQLNTLFAQLETVLGIEAPHLKMAFKITLTLVDFFDVWIKLSHVLSFIEKRIKKINLKEN